MMVAALQDHIGEYRLAPLKAETAMAHKTPSSPKPDEIEAESTEKTVAIVGLMGAGKSSVGRRLAKAMGRQFFDSDDEIEKAAGQRIPEIFEDHGEESFRRGEQKVIARLLQGPPHVLATGGGAYMNAQTRNILNETAVTVWLYADFETLWKRVSRRSHRPLLRQPNPRGVLRDLQEAREPIYALADVHVESVDGAHSETVNKILRALESWSAERRG